MTLLSIQDLTLSINGLTILDRVSLTVDPGEIVAIIGESGSGKSVTALATMGLLPVGFKSSGSIRLDTSFAGVADILATPEPTLCSLRGRDMGMVFQEPMTAH